MGGREMDRVGQWQRFEAAVQNGKAYRDPYRDVTLEATYQRPDGSEIRGWGFYDGGHTWRARMMPDQIGTWRDHVSFSDGTPGQSDT